MKEIEISTEVNQSLVVDIDDEVYTFNLRFYENIQKWYLDILKDEKIIESRIPINLQGNLIGRKRYLDFGILIVDNSGQRLDAFSLFDFEERLSFYILEKADLTNEIR